MHGRDTRRHHHQNQGGNYNNYGYGDGRGGGAPRNHVIPTEPPFTAYIGNAPETMVQGDFEKHLFVGLKVKQVRLVRDRQTDRFRGFAYVDFDDAESLRSAIALDGTCVNDRSIRIDVAVRPLGATRNEGFRNKPGFQNQDNRRHPSGNTNRSSDNYHQGGRNHYSNSNQQTHMRKSSGEQGENQQNEEQNPTRNRHSSGSARTNERHPSQTQAPREHKTPPRQISNDDVFIAPDTPASNEDALDSHNQDENSGSIARQHSRNWADCPIDETVVETTSPPPSANNTFTSDDFQVVRNKNTKTRPMGNTGNRGRNNGNYNRGGGGRGFYDQTSPPYYNNQPQPYYHQARGNPQNMASNYSHQNPHPNNQRHPGSAGNRQRHNSNRSTNSRSNYENNNPTRSARGPSTKSEEFEENPSAAENRPRLQLLPRSQKLPSASEETSPSEPAARNASIFGSGKPRDERDPKIMELNKHIEEVVEKEQQAPRTKSTTSNGSNEGVIKPVRILTAPNKSRTDP